MQKKLIYTSIILLVLISFSCKNRKKEDSQKSKVETELKKEDPSKVKTKFNKDFYTEVGACPFEGCTYGEWITTGKVEIFKSPSLDSGIIGSIPADESFTALNGKIEIVPGIAFKVKDMPTSGNSESGASAFDYHEPIYILHYIGEGFNKVYQNGKFNSLYLELPTDGNVSAEWKADYDWLKIEKFPTEFKWWAEVVYSNLKGWILVDDKVAPIDRFSFVIQEESSLIALPALKQNSSLPIGNVDCRFKRFFNFESGKFSFSTKVNTLQGVLFLTLYGILPTIKTLN